MLLRGDRAWLTAGAAGWSTLLRSNCRSSCHARHPRNPFGIRVIRGGLVFWAKPLEDDVRLRPAGIFRCTVSPSAPIENIVADGTASCAGRAREGNRDDCFRQIE